MSDAYFFVDAILVRPRETPQDASVEAGSVAEKLWGLESCGPRIFWTSISGGSRDPLIASKHG